MHALRLLLPGGGGGGAALGANVKKKKGREKVSKENKIDKYEN